MKISDILTEDEDKEFSRKLDAYYKAKSEKAKATRASKNPFKFNAKTKLGKTGNMALNIGKKIAGGLKKFDKWATKDLKSQHKK
jgi:hypothetical protein